MIKEARMIEIMSPFPNFPTFVGIFDFVEGQVIVTSLLGLSLRALLNTYGIYGISDLFMVGK
jgi:hypothetical protein